MKSEVSGAGLPFAKNKRIPVRIKSLAKKACLNYSLMLNYFSSSLTTSGN